MLIVFTGNGKGKTTSALGVALRALGWGKKIAIIQFIKGNKDVGEWKIIKEVNSPQLEIFQFFDDKKLSITEGNILENPKYKKSCEKAWSFAKETILSRNYDLVVLDEICNAMHYKLLNEKEICGFVGAKNFAPEIDLIMTGRNASKKLIDVADMVTEMQEIKHPFKNGISAKKGVDY